MSGGKFGYTELHVGVPFPPAALEAVRLAVPSREIQSLLYSGATCAAEEARTRGFIDEVVPPAELTARALEVARHYASVPRETFVATKRQLRAATLARMYEVEEQLHESTVAAWSSPAIQAHMRAYLDRVVKKKA
jgi:enoyl-CoA hydratase